MLHRQLTMGVREEAGDTLVELLIAVVIIALSVTALLGALITSLTSSAEHRSLANLDTVVKGFAESAKYQIELQPSGSWFTDCASVSGMAYNGNAVPYTPPQGYTVGFTEIGYWNSSSDKFDQGTCGAGDHTGYQMLTITAAAPSGVSETISFGVRSST